MNDVYLTCSPCRFLLLGLIASNAVVCRDSRHYAAIVARCPWRSSSKPPPWTPSLQGVAPATIAIACTLAVSRPPIRAGVGA